MQWGAKIKERPKCGWGRYTLRKINFAPPKLLEVYPWGVYIFTLVSSEEIPRGGYKPNMAETKWVGTYLFRSNSNEMCLCVIYLVSN